ncbi:MAG: isocitrate lyase/phosphoenolpyruvate mutase family protein, partial [Acidobacteria bacterium]|nr:isocitrate lyase/phosphoenolpyruvate mutase family protein [Acidobacteriota bacterium]
MNHEPGATGDQQQLGEKARLFLSLHDGPGLLILPNIWDPLGARLLQSLGYPAVGPASAARAASSGNDDGAKPTLKPQRAGIRPGAPPG